MKPDVKHLWKTKKKWIIGITAGVAAAAVGCVFWYQAGHSSKEPVYVYPFQYIGMTEYWGDSQESYGPVTTDKIQTVFLSDTQTVTQTLVAEGDAVKKGDLLMTFDTTLSDLQLERKRLDVEKQKLQLEDAKDELKKINSMKPVKEPEISDEPEEETNQGFPISERIYPVTMDLVNRRTYDGSSAQKALIYWIKESTQIGSSLFREADKHAAMIQALNAPAEPEQPDDPEQPGDSEDTEGTESTEGTENTESTEGSENTESTESTEGTENTESMEGTEGAENTESAQSGQNTEEPVQSSASAVENVSLPDGSVFYVVIKVTANDMTLGATKTWQCLKVTKSGSSYSFQFEDAAVSDYSVRSWFPDGSAEDIPQEDPGGSYTAEQIAQMRSDKQKEIKDLEFKIRMTEAEYKIMQKEVSDGNIYADNDGKVVSLLTEEEARQTRQPILKVSGGGGFYIEGFVNELEKDKMQHGQEVTVNDWNTGMTYTGNVESIGDFPTQEGYYNGSGNPNASYYPFKVFVDETADLQAGAYVSVMYSSAESQNGIYLENPFLRTEKGKSYVLVLGTNGKLEQRWVTTGKSLWGSYTEILEGLTAEDLIAFPYGKNVKPGAAAQEGDLSNLYG